MSLPSLRPLGFGEILDGAFTLYRRNFVTFFLTALIPVVAVIAALVLLGGGLFAAMGSADPEMYDGAAAGGAFMIFVVAAVAFAVMWAALTRHAAQGYLGQPTSVPDGFVAGFKALLPLAGAGIVLIIAFIVVAFAVAMALGVVVAIAGASGDAATTLLVAFVAFFLFLIIYLAVAALVFALVPAIVVEGKGPLEAIGRSFDLARGAVMRIVGLMLVTLCITYLPGLAVTALTGGFAQFFDPQAMPSGGQLMLQQVLALGVSALTTPFICSVIVLLYFDRRVRTEALDVRMAAEGIGQPVS